jgi:hypothetical protein
MMQQRVLRYDQSADPTIAKSVFFRTRKEGTEDAVETLISRLIFIEVMMTSDQAGFSHGLAIALLSVM